MSSLDSHTMGPTLTMLGRGSEWIRLVSMAEAAVTGSLLPRDLANAPRGAQSVPCLDPAQRYRPRTAQPRMVQLADLAAPALADGDTVLPPFTPAVIFTQLRLDSVVAVFLLIAAALYGYGVYRLRQRGDSWPIGRTAAFVLGGLGSIAAVTVSGIEAYDDTLLSVHMVQHMVL